MINEQHYATYCSIMNRVQQASHVEEKNDILLSHIRLDTIIKANPLIEELLVSCTMHEKNAFYQAILVDNGVLIPRLHWPVQREEFFLRARACIASLVEIDLFYSSIGGLLGYYLAICKGYYTHNLREEEENIHTHYAVPPIHDFRSESRAVWEYIRKGLFSLNECSEFYVVGGAGDRLNLIDPLTGNPKPAATLHIFDKTLLEWLFDDLDAREYLYLQITGKKISVPVVLMTSEEKGNNQEIENLCRDKKWFYRDPKRIQRIVQPLVPLVDISGSFAVRGYFQLFLKPGGHGIIWKLAKDFGIYDWLRREKISSIIIRQINNPISGMDATLCALPGQGIKENRAFGFVSCPRKEGFHEGLNVLQCQKKSNNQFDWSLSNIEYVAFETLHHKTPELFTEQTPANVNLLFANIESLIQATQTIPFPGLIVNYKNEVETLQQNGKKRVVRCARLESTMQNISEAFFTSSSVEQEQQPLASDLPTFIQLYNRSVVLSATKRLSDKSHGIIYETPLSFLYDWVQATRELLQVHCQSQLPKTRISFQEFLEKGPEFCFLFHPSLGPLWSIIGQKIKKLYISEGSMLNIGIPEISFENINLDGSLRIDSSISLQQQMQDSIFPKAFFKNVHICNKRYLEFSSKDTTLVSGQHAALHIQLEGKSEIWVEDVTIQDELQITVPDGMRAIILPAKENSYAIHWEEISLSLSKKYSWSYLICWEDGSRPSFKLCLGEDKSTKRAFCNAPLS